MRKIVESLEAGNVVDVFHDAIRIQKATAYMVYLLLKEGDGQSDEMCEGVSLMLEHQAELLEDINHWVEIKQSLLTDFYDQEDKKRSDAEHASEKVLGLRRRMIAEAIGQGAKANEIAEAVNMRRANVEKVIRQLQGEEPTSQSKAANG